MLADPIRRNFGFMFTYMGRAIFLIFVSAVCFGMLNTDQSGTPWYSWAAGAGAGTLINAFINCIVICSHPGFKELSKAADAELNKAPAGAFCMRARSALSRVMPEYTGAHCPGFSFFSYLLSQVLARYLISIALVPRATRVLCVPPLHPRAQARTRQK